MKQKWKILCAICIIASMITVVFPQKPKLISNITTMDTAYLTILVNRWETRNVNKLEEKILQMCREDSFENMKLYTEDRPLIRRWIISVYGSKHDLEKGNPFLIIKKDAGD